MQITNVRIREITGTMKYTGILMNERTCRPIDIYPEWKAQTAADEGGWGRVSGHGTYEINQCFIQVDTDEGISGLFGPVNSAGARFYIDTQLKPLLIGRDPITSELLWDQMYRHAIHGRKGDNMIAISAIDIALWDIKGKWLNQPVYRLLGGPVREKIPAYASAIGYSLELDEVRERVKQFVHDGYTATKWFLREGPTDGPEGIRKNVDVIKTVRDTAGPDMEIMIDAWNSWDIPYTLKIAELVKVYQPLWIEEPVMPDLAQSYVQLREKCPIAIAGGEHEYTRWGVKMLLDLGAMDVYQVDPIWAGGISELMKIYALASVYDVKVIPHGGVEPVLAQVAFTQNAAITPMMEYQNVLNVWKQFFYKHTTRPADGYIYPPVGPGIGIELDESKIETEKDISYR
jgi:L-alanine-DL-glutamate epimerase-like enolase superfamily enzyme